MRTELTLLPMPALASSLRAQAALPLFVETDPLPPEQ